MAKYPTEVDAKITGSKIDHFIFGGSFDLRELSLHSPSNPSKIRLNAAGVFVELNIFEDLFSNVLRGTLSFVDNQGIAERITRISERNLRRRARCDGETDSY